MLKIKRIIKKFKSKKIKLTPQRSEIINILMKYKIHPTAETIYKIIKKKFSSISLATIYNTLEILEELKELKKLKINNKNVINYEFNMDPHDHFYCEKCEDIYDVEGSKIQDNQVFEEHEIQETQI